MNGQWIGPYTGTNSGALVLEIDDLGDHFEGRAYAYEDNPELPSTSAFIKTENKARRFNLAAGLAPIHKHTGELLDWEIVRKDYSNLITVPKTIETEWDWDENRVVVQWATDIGTSGIAELRKGRAGERSDYEPLEIHTWDEFRKFVRELEYDRYIYRGQEDAAWRLRTAFHRTGRADALRFLSVDVPSLHQHLCCMTQHVFDLTQPVEHGAFVGLAQHHGYPTPLLDWTHSPFIAAYFAFKKARHGGSVRIFIFDAKKWRADFNQLAKLAPARPHFSLAKFLSINNPRMVPQQALSSITNVDDIEEYIRSRERERATNYLSVIDLPASERLYAMSELRLMGITAGSLFPGLDGACEQLKDQNFIL